MPIYTYKCLKCDSIYNERHRITEVLKDCKICESKDSLKKLLTNFSVGLKEKSNDNKKVGDVVKKSIEEFKEDLKNQKKDLKTKVYKDE